MLICIVKLHKMHLFVQISKSDIKNYHQGFKTNKPYFLKQDILSIIQWWKYNSHCAAA